MRSCVVSWWTGATAAGLLALGAALGGCSGGGDPDPFGTGPDGTAGDDDDDVVAPTAALACADAGPDAPVIPSYTMTVTTFEGYDTVYWFPSSPRAVVWYFHGGEKVTEINDMEQTAFLNHMAAANIGFLITAKDGHDWDTNAPADANEEMPRLERLRDSLIADGKFDADTPIVTLGFSDGGAMSSHFAAHMDEERGWPIAAALIHSSGGGDVPSVPVWMTIQENDKADISGSAQRKVDDSIALGNDTRFEVSPERTTTPELFLRRAQWDLTDAQEAFDDAVAGGIIDAQGARLVPDDVMDQALDQYENDSLMVGAANVTARLHVTWALHRFSAWYAEEECTFALAALDRMGR